MFGVPRPRESGDLWGKNSFFPFFYAWFLFSRDENGSYFCRTIFSFCPFLRVVLIFAGTKWFIFSRPHQKRENMNTRSLKTRKWSPREKMDVYSMRFLCLTRLAADGPGPPRGRRGSFFRPRGSLGPSKTTKKCPPSPERKNDVCFTKTEWCGHFYGVKAIKNQTKRKKKCFLCSRMK